MTSQKVKKILTTNFSATPYYPTIADCIRWTEVLNHIMFHGSVPKWRKITVRRIRGNWGWCIGSTSPKRKKKSCELIINEKFPSFAAFYSVLAHELVHSAEYHQTGTIDHGDFFMSHQEMLANFGIKLKESYVSR